MNKFLLLLVVFVLSLSQVSAYDQIDINAANFLADKWIIESSTEYNLNSTITRREMLKVMMNLSEKEVSDTCEWKFQDLNSNDWGCKYAEAALAEWYIAANDTFRPDDSVTQAEALKMIMQARGISAAYIEDYSERKISDWREAYEIWARYNQLLWFGWDTEKVWLDLVEYNKNATRSFTFLTSARTWDDFILNFSYWSDFLHPSWWSVKYPENWTYRDDGNTVLFWPKTPNGLDTFNIQATHKNYNDLISEWHGLNETWTINSQSIQDIQTDTGLQWKIFITQVSSQWDINYSFSKAILEWSNSMNYILSWELGYLKWFYKTFKIVSPEVVKQGTQVYNDFEVIDGKLYFSWKGVSFNYNKVERWAGEFNILDQLTFDTYQWYRLEWYPDYDFMPEAYNIPILIEWVDMWSFTEYGRGTEWIVYLDLDPIENEGRSYLTKILVAEDKNNLYYVLEYRYGCMWDTVWCLWEEEIEVISK